ncbi:hypothetical protein ACIOYV_17190 [Pseudomonas sp. NPDC087342]|jgi:hypothetical protein|uniref:Uncharacterized protein n=1 Tax=Pseudomonas frederiksbergensis TaxID=104087 RepID=A0A6L5BKV2_9PSED|nr:MULTISPECIES: hypothetical protein [Pseudomonas]KAF2389286.1 hypothetical protein FX983_03725 [Pseudomonas frederiksbergensis]MDN3218793.1 hypothetical protein [Pseudomonas nunensis]
MTRSMQVWKWLNHVLSAIGVLAIIALVTLFISLRPSNPSTPVLPGHPDAVWRGAQDGGFFIEITQSNPPDYFVQVRYEHGDIYSEGWVRFQTPDGKPLTMARVNSADDGYVYVDSYLPMTANKEGARP